MTRIVFDIRVDSRAGIEDARAIAMQTERVLVHHVPDGGDALDRVHGASPLVCCVLDRHQRGGRIVVIRLQHEAAFDLFRRQDAAGAGEGA